MAETAARYSDVDVRVAVASCISEITRITTPDAPYDDDQMKDIVSTQKSLRKSTKDGSKFEETKRLILRENIL
ncbi:hypothetical protein PanWU01x14_032160 [Parasponia andersonii]|uniref:Uncharacterized protein n=1 Tax=Parasponia andersonii TaxID=3476 RepID=A0A2P5DUE1_PARAD|nr:hypothetical protein PanWU01x14_032160 [Parasponia andersonii]